MENYSQTQAANLTILIGILGMVLRHFRVVIPESELSAFVAGAVALGGLVWSWYHRYSRGDLTIVGARK